MAVTFYTLSGSPFSWKVWLALEHKGIAYDLKVLSADAGDLKTPEFLALNPRGKVPVIADEGFVLAESWPIIEYLEERYAGRRLWPADVQARAHARRLAAEGDSNIYPEVRKLVVELVMRTDGNPDIVKINAAKAALKREFVMLDGVLSDTFVAGDEPCAGDFALYPLAAILQRVGRRRPEFELADLVPRRVAGWMGRVEGLAYFAATLPPHWRTS